MRGFSSLFLSPKTILCLALIQFLALEYKQHTCTRECTPKIRGSNIAYTMGEMCGPNTGIRIVYGRHVHACTLKACNHKNQLYPSYFPPLCILTSIRVRTVMEENLRILHRPAMVENVLVVSLQILIKNQVTSS